MPAPLQLTHSRLDWTRAYIVAVLNVTPDSFSDGGAFLDPERALARAAELVEQGADWIDIGGESTRPGAEPTPLDEELRRTVPVVERLAKSLPVTLSIDTYKAEVARAALDAGAEVVNDISGGQLDAGLLEVCAERRAAVVLGHLRGTPKTMQEQIKFRDVLAEVGHELSERVAVASATGVPAERIMVDPGLGFGKTSTHNFALLGSGAVLAARTGCVVMMGPSRKRFLGELSGRPAELRGPETAAACVAAVLSGASLVRVHDVAEVALALRVVEGIRVAGRGDA